VLCESLYFCELEVHAKIRNPFWYFSNAGKKKKRERKISASANGGPRFWVCVRETKISKIVANLICSIGRTHFAPTNFLEKDKGKYILHSGLTFYKAS
jgi:hypothetical protein